MAVKEYMVRGWNSKRLGAKRSPNASGQLETDVWCYLTKTGRLDIIISVSESGVVRGQTSYTDIRLPRKRK